MRWLRWVALGLGLAVAAAPVALAQTWYESAEGAIADTEAQFNAGLETVEQTQALLERFERNSGKAEDVFLDLIKRNRGNPDAVAELKKALLMVRKVQAEVHDHAQSLALVSRSGKHVKAGFEAYHELIDLRDRARARKGGPLAAQLTVLAKAMEKYGGDIPLIGKAIALYGEITNGILDATDKLAGSIEENFRQDMMGPGLSQNTYDPRYLALKKQLGPASQITLAPVGPGFVFRDIHNEATSADYIWDEEGKRWFVVKGGQPAAAVFAKALKAGKRLGPELLAVHTEKSAAAAKREAEAKALSQILREVYASIHITAMSEADRRFGHGVYLDARAPDYFAARFAYDGDYRGLALDYVAQLWADAVTTRGAREKAREIEAVFARIGLHPRDHLSPAALERMEERRRALQNEAEAREADRRAAREARERAAAERRAALEAAEKDAPAPVPQTQGQDTRPVAPSLQREDATPSPLPTAQIVPWDKATPRGVCLGYEARISQFFQSSSFTGLQPTGRVEYDADKGVCHIHFTGAHADVGGKSLAFESYRLEVSLKEARNRLSHHAGETAYGRACKEWRTIEWCANSQQHCVARETSDPYCIAWEGQVLGPKTCKETATRTFCAEYGSFCIEPRARTYCKAWGPAPKPARADPPQPATEATAQPETGSTGGVTRAQCEAFWAENPQGRPSLGNLSLSAACQAFAKP